MFSSFPFCTPCLLCQYDFFTIMALAAIQCKVLAVKKYRPQSHGQYKQFTWEKKTKKSRSKILLSLH
jgi:hypothetical protein